MNVQEINFELHIRRRAFGNYVKLYEAMYFCFYFQTNFTALIIYWVHIFRRSITTYHFRVLNFIAVGVISPLKCSHPACNYYQVHEIYGLSVVLAFTGITLSHVWWKSVIRFKSWKWNMYKHKQKHFNFKREFVHFSEEIRPKGGDIVCVGWFVKEWEWKLWRKTKEWGCGEV